ncbi:MAG: serine/threonine protein phosphatase [Ruminococcaceae bacterium]|nr:serine/threonine protein phosphatase [Oscillospiraceae bacterium]
MIYVMSDIHGAYDKYKRMLDKIDFKEEDTLYILGDVIDRGEDGIKILFDMMMRDNVFPFLGNHEYMAYGALKSLSTEITEEIIDTDVKNILELYEAWMENGGASTLKKFRELSLDERESVFDYIEEFAGVEEIKVNGKSFVLVHGTLENFSPERPFDDYSVNEIVWGRCDYDRVYFPDKYLVTGHTPTALIAPGYRGKIYKKNNHIAIDCGVHFTGVLGCICLDTSEEFYVE